MKLKSFIICLIYLPVLVGCQHISEKNMETTPSVSMAPTQHLAASQISQNPDHVRITQLAVEDLATHLDLDPKFITVIEVRPVTWPDSSLGCPQEGMMYTQVETDGYQLFLSAGGQEYVFHADMSENLIFCADKTQTKASSLLVTGTAAYDNYPTLAPGTSLRTPESEEQAPVAQAKEQLARKLNISVNEINIFSILAIEWPDAGLGCPLPGINYADVITPGYKISLEWNRAIYTFHTDTIERVVLCHVQPPHEIYSEP